jgi:uncharacterized membrane protein
MLTIISGVIIYFLSEEKIMNVIYRSDPVLSLNEQESIDPQYVNMSQLNEFDITFMIQDYTETI